MPTIAPSVPIEQPLSGGVLTEREDQDMTQHEGDIQVEESIKEHDQPTSGSGHQKVTDRTKRVTLSGRVWAVIGAVVGTTTVVVAANNIERVVSAARVLSDLAKWLLQGTGNP